MLRQSLRALRRVDPAAVGTAAAPQWVLQFVRPFSQAAQDYQVDPVRVAELDQHALSVALTCRKRSCKSD